ncbi:MAG: hypothetical protein R3D29_13885 [Nitratireductor sp.]
MEINLEIGDFAAKLARLLAERTKLNSESGFCSDVIDYPIDLMNAASSENYLYNNWVKPELEASLLTNTTENIFQLCKIASRL